MGIFWGTRPGAKSAGTASATFLALALTLLTTSCVENDLGASSRRRATKTSANSDPSLTTSTTVTTTTRSSTTTFASGVTTTTRPSTTVTTTTSSSSTSITTTTTPSTAQAPDLSAVVYQIRDQNPGIVARSCTANGGDNEFLFKVVKALQAQDPRWGLKWDGGVVGKLDQDEVLYALGDGPYGADPGLPSFRYEETTSIASVDIIASLCGANPQATWQPAPANGGKFAGLLHLTPPAEHFPGGTKDTPPAFLLHIVQQVHQANPSLIQQSCKETGGNNLFMINVLTELRKLSPRWGLNWKRGVQGDLSQDVVSYAYDLELPPEESRVQIVDIIRGHCGPTPEPAWGWVANEGLGRWTLDPL